jgi:hypothetical protein
VRHYRGAQHRTFLGIVLRRAESGAAMVYQQVVETEVWARAGMQAKGLCDIKMPGISGTCS